MHRSVLLALLATLVVALTPSVAHAATCSEYSTQAAAQTAADTRDGDGDGVYCEDLPCPCSTGSGQSDGGSDPAPAPSTPKPTPAKCTRPKRVQPIGFSKTKYPNIRQHYLDAVHDGWPRILVLNRPGSDARRDRLLEGFATQDGQDRDEYPPAVGRGRGSRGLTRGIDPIGWMADVAYVPSSENRSHGSVLGIKLRRLCNGTRFRYVFY